ncbi:MAG: secretin N-terminal domain-containing protein [Devosia sp.]
MFAPVRAVSSPSKTGTAIGYANGQQVSGVYEVGVDQGGDLDSAPADPALASRSVTLSFVDTDVREFARVLFSELLLRPYTVDRDLNGSVTVRSGGEVDGVTALAMARQALEATGNTVILSEGVYRVTTLANRQLDASAGMKTFKLRYIDGGAARDALAPFLDGRAEMLSVSNSSIAIRGDSEVVALAGSLLATIDIDRFKQSSFALFPLQNGKAEDMAIELKSLYDGAGVSGETLLPIERLNAVLVVTSKPSQLEFARTWVARLDHGRTDDRQISVYQVKNREADTLAKLLQEIFATAHIPVATEAVASSDAVSVSEAVFGAQGSDAGALKVTADAGSNSLVIWASPRELDVIHQALRRLDTPLEQVYVEATIAEVRLNGELSHGVRWFLQSGPLSAGITDTSNGAIAPDYPGFNFSFKVPQAQVVISALESYTDVTIVSSPQLTVINHQTATIQVGDQVPIVTKSVQDTSSGVNIIANDVTFRDTGVILKVTPDIRASGEVLLNIEQEVSRVLPTTSSQINSPTISQRKVQSTVLVPDGEAIVLGGLMSASDETASGSLPGTQKTILESIFGSKSVKAGRSELIIIIRPVIIRSKDDLREVVAEIADKLSSLDIGTN